MNITLFGGAFNPPHLGHLIVIQQAFELIPNMVELWLLPVYRHTFQKHLAPTNHRLQMVKFLLQTIPDDLNKKVKLNTTEIENKLSGETFEALQHLKRKYPSHNFSFLMGTDNLKDFKKWGSWEKLLKEIHFYVYPRAGYQNNIKFPNMTLLKSPTQVVTNLSSTLIRQRIRNNQSLTNLLPSQINKYIDLKKLY